MKYNELNSVLHSPVRLAVMSFLIANGDADFKTLQKELEVTPGNLSVQLRKLEEAAYIQIIKTFKDNYQHTIVKLLPQGLDAFEEYVNTLQQYISVKPKKSQEDEN